MCAYANQSIGNRGVKKSDKSHSDSEQSRNKKKIAKSTDQPSVSLCPPGVRLNAAQRPSAAQSVRSLVAVDTMHPARCEPPAPECQAV